MISRQCPRMVYGREEDWGEVLEAFALTYLAQYVNSALPARVSDSYKRAWAFDVMHTWPRVVNARPNVLVTYSGGDGVNKVHVAIEGATSVSQVLNIWRGAGTSPVAGMSGQVYTQALVYADQIITLLAADANWTAALLRPNTLFSFSGFSLGAMIAEYLAFKFQLGQPTKQVRLFKFGCPRSGNRNWYNGRNRRVRVYNYYCERDPISLIPKEYAEVTLIANLPWGGMLGVQPLSQDPICQTYDRNGRSTGGYHPDRVRSFAGPYGDLVRAMTIDNPWFFHDTHMYRAMFSGIAVQNPLLAYRFMYLEHPDENMWGSEYSTFTWQTPPRRRLISPTPTDVTPDQVGADALFVAPPVVQEQLPQLEPDREAGATAGGDWGGSIEEGGGDWSEPETIRPREVPQPTLAGPIAILPARLGRRRN